MCCAFLRLPSHATKVKSLQADSLSDPVHDTNINNPPQSVLRCPIEFPEPLALARPIGMKPDILE